MTQKTTVWGAHADSEDHTTDNLAATFRRLTEGQGEQSEAMKYRSKVAAREPFITAVVQNAVQQVGGTLDGFALAGPGAIEETMLADAVKSYDGDRSCTLRYTVRLQQRHTVFAVKSQLARTYEPAGEVFDGDILMTRWRTVLDKQEPGEPLTFEVIFLPM